MLHAGLHVRQGAVAADSSLRQVYELFALGSPNGKAADGMRTLLVYPI